MNADVRRAIDMGVGADEFTGLHPDPNAGYTQMATDLKSNVATAKEAAGTQVDGRGKRRAASARKFEVRRVLRKAHLPHLIRAAHRAAVEMPELAQRFVLPSRVTAFTPFATAVRSMLASARAHKDLLVKYGLAESVLDGIQQALDQFDAAVTQGADARQAHVQATADLHRLAGEIVRIVNLLDAYNEVRFADQPQVLAAWKSAIRRGTPKPKSPEQPQSPTPPAAGGEIKPAA
jgi:hypothetical protein